MTVPDLDLFAWWAISISGGSIFLTLISIYLYTSTRAKRRELQRESNRTVNLLKNFVFIWVLLGLLAFYIVSIQIRSAAIFAAGNILVEVLLIVYLIRNRTKKSREE
jgi:heme A synthase